MGNTCNFTPTAKISQMVNITTTPTTFFDIFSPATTNDGSLNFGPTIVENIQEIFASTDTTLQIFFKNNYLSTQINPTTGKNYKVNDIFNPSGGSKIGIFNYGVFNDATRGLFIANDTFYVPSSFFFATIDLSTCSAITYKPGMRFTPSLVGTNLVLNPEATLGQKIAQPQNNNMLPILIAVIIVIIIVVYLMRNR